MRKVVVFAMAICLMGCGSSTQTDSSLPKISINDVSIQEGDNGSQNHQITITLSEYTNPVSLIYTFSDYTDDVTSSDYTYEKKTDTVEFTGSSTSVGIDLTVHGDNIIEPDEVITITLSNIIGDAEFNNSVAFITIVNDETAALNDTGITSAGLYPSGNNSACSGDTVDAQDCTYGRDTDSNVKENRTGSGVAAFDFTKIDMLGKDLPITSIEWSCVKDNHTGLIWEKKNTTGLHNKDDLYTWYGLDANNATLGTQSHSLSPDSCDGYDVGSVSTYCNTSAYIERTNEAKLCELQNWRLPTITELANLASLSGIAPSIDTDFFPNAELSAYWSSTAYSVDETRALAYFFLTDSLEDALVFETALKVRLVHDSE